MKWIAVVAVSACAAVVVSGAVNVGGAAARGAQTGAGDLRLGLDALEERIRRIEEADQRRANSPSETALQELRSMGVDRRSPSGIAAMRRFLEQHPNHAEAAWVAHECVAAMLILSGPAEARKVVEARIALDGERFELVFDLATVMLAERDYDAALLKLERLAQTSDCTPEQKLRARFYRAYAMLESGRFESAAQEFDALAAEYRDSRNPDEVSFAQGAELQSQRAREWNRRR